MLHVSGCAFGSVINYFAGLPRLTEMNLTFCPPDELVCLEGK